jgi:putative FmdB family regulatory protein
MPLYEYQCDACGHRFETIQKFSDPLVDKCPKCGAPVRKLQSAPAIQFKGSGFYITDYAKKDHVAAAKADSAPSDGKEGAEKTDKAAPAADKSAAAPAKESTATASSAPKADAAASKKDA